MQTTRRTRRQELVLEGKIHLPLALFDFEKFRQCQGSVGKDRRRLRRKYWKAGIPEYWLVDARGAKPVHFQFLRRGETDYEPVEPDDERYRFSSTFQRRFKIVRRTNPVGRYDYRLLQRKHESQ